MHKSETEIETNTLQQKLPISSRWEADSTPCNPEEERNVIRVQHLLCSQQG